VEQNLRPCGFYDLTRLPIFHIIGSARPDPYNKDTGVIVMGLTETWNADFIDAQYKQWRNDPHSVSKEWQLFFEGFELASSGRFTDASVCVDEEQMLLQSRVQKLIYRYRDLGHLMACLDPLTACPTDHPLLNLSAFNLTPEDLDRQVYTSTFSASERAFVRDIQAGLKQTYCRSIGVEFMHLQDPAERNWLLDRMEPIRNKPDIEAPVKRRIMEKLIQAALFEKFLNKKYIAVTRFSLEGGDAIIPALDLVIDHVAQRGCREIILGMAHRGRLNVQANILQKPYEEIFSEFESCYSAENLIGAGDVKYHNGFLADLKTPSNHPLRLFLMNNPSHLEAVNPVVEGFVRARQDIFGDYRRQKVMALLIHGDAAFAGQGIVAETLNMSQLAGYKTGGTLHLVINNQIGYTTLPENARSTRYSTDIAKMLMVPIFHVHGENPEALAHVFTLAADYRWEFGKDVVIDVVCYRRYGHNEGDEPYFTQPQMYERIRQRPSLHQMYAEDLIEQNVVAKSEIEALMRGVNERLENAYDSIHGSECPFPFAEYYENWQDFHGVYSHDPIDTAIEKKTLISLSQKLNRVPDNFALNPKLDRLLKKRQQSIDNETGIDWANAEALALGSLLAEGKPVRLSGQDSGRGTFSQRHAVFFDIENGKQYTPLAALEQNQAEFRVYNSLLSEMGVMGFEYGYAIAQPEGLVLWEAQFGDFANNAQSIIDLFIASGESKWQRLSGLVLLLPHGSEGLGPEHSSARPERFLQLCANDNMQICNPTVPSQYFHLLRRQALSPYRKPLVILTPKSLLRHPLAVSHLEEFVTGHFQTVLDVDNNAEDIDKVLLCSGKVFFDLAIRRNELKLYKTAIVRLEQLYPFPQDQLAKVVETYGGARQWHWVQEEPENMGAWHFVRPRLEALIGDPIGYIGRTEASSPATGFPALYQQEQAEIIDRALGPAAAN
jgi:2-oxoglutarate dehydrogenase E1 component